MHIIVCKDYEEMSRKAAALVAEGIQARPDGLISFPGGDTPLGMVREFVDMVNRGEVDISRTHYVSLDEWVGPFGHRRGPPAASLTVRICSRAWKSPLLTSISSRRSRQHGCRAPGPRRLYREVRARSTCPCWALA